MENKEFAVFILTHGRPDNVKTLATLKKCGYTGKIYFIVDNEDKTIDNEFYNNIIKKLNKEIAILGGNESKITLEMLIESIVKTDGSHNTGLKIIQDRNGKSFLEFKIIQFSHFQIFH